MYKIIIPYTVFVFNSLNKQKSRAIQKNNPANCLDFMSTKNTKRFSIKIPFKGLVSGAYLSLSCHSSLPKIKSSISIMTNFIFFTS